MPLVEYHRKRNFRRTPEPKGRVPKGKVEKQRGKRSGSRYVIQKHDATRLHYDFRLELDGVLKSWAVPKGPSLDPAEKRLAVEVEDHPIEYGGFEGVIPEGEYGGGTVVLWDRGRWKPLGDPHADLAAGKLKFTLDGEKLTGGWTLVRIRGREGDEGRNNWLLIKEDDEAARPLSRGDIVAERPESVASGRSLEEIAEERDRVWHSGKAARGGAGAAGKPRTLEDVASARKPTPRKPTAKKPARKAAPKKAASKKELPKKAPPKKAAPKREAKPPARAPRKVTARKSSAALRATGTSTTRARRMAIELPSEPQLATLVERPPAGEGWLHELKFDGYRVLARWDGKRPRLFTRHGLDWTARFPSVAAAVGKLGAGAALLDGEVVALTADGKPSFQALQRTLREGKGELAYYVFDLLHEGERDLRGLPLSERKASLASLLARQGDGVLRFSDHIEGRGGEFYASACRLGLEGMVSKRAEAPYRPGRNRDWLKIKCTRRQEAVIGGFTEPSGTRSGLGALLLGVMEGGKLRYSGKCGTGFDTSTLRELRRRLEPLERKTAPFDPAPRGAEVKGAHWVEPRLVAEVSFAEWTEDGRMRQPSFEGLREDKEPSEVRREVPVSPPPAASKTGAGMRRQSGDAKSGHRAAGGSRRSAPSVGGGRAEGPGGVPLSHPDRVLYPEQGLTKLDLAHYYERVADWVLPYIARRPLTLVRCPQGRSGHCFYQKHPHEEEAGGALHTVPIREDDGKVEPYLYVEDLAGLVSLVQMGVLELHPWGAHVEDVEKPDLVVFDLDPDPKLPWSELVSAARLVRERLADRGLESWVKTTGGKGLHICAPLSGKPSWDALRAFAREVAEGLAREEPERFLSKASKAARAGKIFVDWLRNGRGATAVAAYSTRARPGATVATPLTWEELARTRPDRWTVETVPRRLARLARDPWAGFFEARQQLPKRRERR